MKSHFEEMKPLISLAAPIAFSHMANMLMQIVDTFFVGRLGPEAIGGVSLGSGLFAIVMMVAVGLLLGLDYSVSIAFGGKKYDECHNLLIQGFYLSLILALPLIGVLEFSAHHFEYFGIAPNLAHLAGDYLKALAFSLLPFLLFTACRQYLQATGTAGPILAIFIAANLINALGNWTFIFGHLGFRAMGVAGAGLATNISRWLMLLALVLYTLHRNKKMNFSMRRVGLRLHSKIIRELVGLGIPASGQLLLEVGVFVTCTFMIGRLGAIPLAAHQIVLQIASLTFMVPLGISAASAVVVGQSLGASHPERAVRLGNYAIILSGCIMAIFGTTLFIFGRPIIGAFTQDASVVVIARQLLLVAAFFQIFDGIQVTATGSLRGAGTTRASLLANLFGHWAIGLPIGLTLCFLLHWNAVGMWVGLITGLATVAVALLFVWKNKTRELLASPGGFISQVSVS
jgi:MATE family multidrug resistance protein